MGRNFVKFFNLSTPCKLCALEFEPRQEFSWCKTCRLGWFAKAVKNTKSITKLGQSHHQSRSISPRGFRRTTDSRGPIQTDAKASVFPHFTNPVRGTAPQKILRTNSRNNPRASYLLPLLLDSIQTWPTGQPQRRRTQHRQRKRLRIPKQ